MMDRSRLIMAEGFFKSFQDDLTELDMLRKQVDDKEKNIIRRCNIANHWIEELKKEIENVIKATESE